MKILIASATVLSGVLLALAGSDYVAVPASTPAATATVAAAPGAGRDLVRECERLDRALGRLHPRGTWVVVDRAHARLDLREDDRVLLRASCSTGSETVLVDHEGARQWTFSTPAGRFEVLARTADPVWRKPDWAFVEVGDPVPARTSDRFEAGVLGEFGLYFGDGYMIHGTLYERLLGRNVTHGCIRLGRQDLRRVYAACPVGTPIYVF